MKRKFVILPLILVFFLLTGCIVSRNENSRPSEESETETTHEEGTGHEIETTHETKPTHETENAQDDLVEDISEIEQIFIEEYKAQSDALGSVKHIVERLGDSGYIAIDSDNKVDMTNADEMMQFISSREVGEHARIIVLQVFNTGGLNIIEITTDEGNVNVEKTYYEFLDNQLIQTVHSEFAADYCEYSDEGYLLINGSWNSAEMYVLTLSDEEEHIALRVKPLDEECRMLCEKYMAPISYNLNNIFITNWSEDDYGSLDFYDVFERFYKETYGKDCPYTMNDDLTVCNEYEIPAEEFENVVMRHFNVSSQELHTLLKFDDNKNVYIYRPRGFDEYDYTEVPYPEVVEYKENDDGSLTLTVNAVYPNDNTSKMFEHIVTVANWDGRIIYLSNEMLGDEEFCLWWHADRLTDGE